MYFRLRLVGSEWVVSLWENDNGLDRYYSSYVVTGNQEDGYDVYAQYDEDECLYSDNSFERCLVWILNS